MNPQPTPSTPIPLSSGPTGTAAWPRPARRLAAGRGTSWWSEGWRVFTAAPALWIGMIVVMVIIILLLNLVPFLGMIAQAILWPMFTGGLLLGCHALAQGKPLTFNHLFAGFKDGHAGPLAILGLIGLAISTVLMLVVMMLGFGAAGMTGAGLYAFSDPSTALGSAWAGAGLAVLLAMLVLLVAGALLWMAWFFAGPLVVLNGAAPLDALKASFRASRANLGALSLFVLVFIALAMVASIPLGLGWLVLGPVAVGASYAAWREVFGA